MRLPGSFEAIGGRRVELADGAVLELGELEPGETGFVRLRTGSLDRVEGAVPIHVLEGGDPPRTASR